MAGRLAPRLQVAAQHAWAAAGRPCVLRAAIGDGLVDAALVRLQPAAACRGAHQGIHQPLAAAIGVHEATAGLLVQLVVFALRAVGREPVFYEVLVGDPERLRQVGDLAGSWLSRSPLLLSVFS